MLATLAPLAGWSPRRWLTAAGAMLVLTLLVAVPTDLVDTRFFSREVPPTWWAWPGLLLSSLLAGLLAATYVAVPDGREAAEDRAARGGWVGGALTFFAVGCPVCNKVVLLALGSAGALTWFEPVQPLLQVAAVALLAWALHARLRGERSCPLPPESTPDKESLHA